MHFQSAFDIGDKVWVNPQDPSIATISKIIIEYTDSPGIPGEELFDNYKPQKSYKERYMCIETGTGSGTLWEPNVNLAATIEALLDEDKNA